MPEQWRLTKTSQSDPIEHTGAESFSRDLIINIWHSQQIWWHQESMCCNMRLMPKIVNEKPYDGFERKVVRLGLVELIDEVKALISQFDLLLLEERDRNSSAAVRRMLDARFTATPGWRKIQSGGIDWTKCIFHNGAEVCVGVELQVSSRSDLLTNDLTHLTRAIEQGDIDAGIIVVPSDTTAYFLTDRVPRFRDALDHVDRAKAQFSPLLILSIGHDGPGPALPR